MFVVGEERIGDVCCLQKKKKGKRRKKRKREKKRNRNLDQKVYSGATITDCTIFVLIEACT